jgi:drug/metabolite transporter (DMT)-like permease
VLLAVAVPAALGAGCSFAVGSVLQQSAAREAPKRDELSWRLLAGLIHRKRWLAGIGSDAFSFGLQALALGFGPLSLVQPLGVSGILFAIPLSVRLRGRRLHAREWAGTLAVAVGLAAFLAAAAPSAGHRAPSGLRWGLVVAAIALLMSLGIGLGRSLHGPVRPSLYGLAAGSAFGLLAALTKASVLLLGQGAAAFFTAWQPYAMLVVALGGAVVQQSAFQAGPLAASLPVMDAVEPSTAAVIGVFAFGEHLATSSLALALQAAGVVLLLTGIVALDRSPVILDLQRRPPARRASAA